MLLATPGIASADWTGVAFEIGDLESDWEFSGDRRVAKSNSLSLQIEERTTGGLTVGGAIGYHSLRLKNRDAGESTKFEVQNLEIYLRQEFPLGKKVVLQGILSYGFYNGDENSSEDHAEIDWRQVSAEIGAAFRFGNWRLTPYTSYTDVDGDTSGVDGGGSFGLEDPFNHGLRFDIFVESTAFISIELQAGSQSGGYLTFVRRY